MAKIKRKGITAGPGCLVEVLGLVLLFFFPIGTLVGIVFLMVGSQMSLKLVCSECGNPIDNKSVKLCPVCKVNFGKTDFHPTSKTDYFESENDKILD